MAAAVSSALVAAATRQLGSGGGWGWVSGTSDHATCAGPWPSAHGASGELTTLHVVPCGVPATRAQPDAPEFVRVSQLCGARSNYSCALLLSLSESRTFVVTTKRPPHTTLSWVPLL